MPIQVSTIMDDDHTTRYGVTDFALLKEAMRRAAWEATTARAICAAMHDFQFTIGAHSSSASG